MTIQRCFAPISGRFEPERVAGFAGISSLAHLRSLQKSPDRIKSFFQSPTTSYAV